MSYYSWKPYVPVAKRRQQAADKLIKLQKKGQTVSPVVIEGRGAIASSFWGKSWCSNLERYSDYANRLPRGRSYVRNGLVLDLKIAKGQVVAKVSGSEVYTIKIGIAPVTKSNWTAICKDCSGSIDSLIALLQGRLDRSVMDRVCRPGDGLFPAPRDIKLSCSCPDWADMCKHVSAALYGVGARLDERPELLFVLRGVDEKDLIASAGTDLTLHRRTAPKGRVLADDDMAALFGLDMAETGAEPASAKTAPAARARRAKAAIGKAPKAAKRKAPKARTAEPTRKRAATKMPS